MDRYLYDESHLSRTLSFNRRDEGEINFLVDPKSGYNASTTFQALDRYFNDEFIEKNASKIERKGGRGETILYTLDNIKAAKLFGPARDYEIEIERARDKARKEQGLQPYMPVPDVKIDDAEQSYGLCKRHYYRGGFVGKFMTDGFLRFDKSALRARLEFELTAKLYRKGLPVPRPLIAREQMGTLWIKNDIVIEQIPNTKNIAEILESSELSQAQMRKIGQMLRLFFDAGLMHTDLNIRNILINDKDECFLIDFDKCELRAELSKSDEMAMLSRLERSFRKEKDLKNYSSLDVELIMTLIRKCAEKSGDHTGIDASIAHDADDGYEHETKEHAAESSPDADESKDEVSESSKDADDSKDDEAADKDADESSEKDESEDKESDEAKKDESEKDSDESEKDSDKADSNSKDRKKSDVDDEAKVD